MIPAEPIAGLVGILLGFIDPTAARLGSKNIYIYIYIYYYVYQDEDDSVCVHQNI